eukprot:4606223-Amphidinium_carterae.1
MPRSEKLQGRMWLGCSEVSRLPQVPQGSWHCELSRVMPLSCIGVLSAVLRHPEKATAPLGYNSRISSQP